MTGSGEGAIAWLISSSEAEMLMSLSLTGAGWYGVWWREWDGGGGRGAPFASPIRRRVRVSCALVGIPFSRELVGCQHYVNDLFEGTGVAYFWSSSNFSQRGYSRFK